MAMPGIDAKTFGEISAFASGKARSSALGTGVKHAVFTALSVAMRGHLVNIKSGATEITPGISACAKVLFAACAIERGWLGGAETFNKRPVTKKDSFIAAVAKGVIAVDIDALDARPPTKSLADLKTQPFYETLKAIAKHATPIETITFTGLIDRF